MLNRPRGHGGDAAGHAVRKIVGGIVEIGGAPGHQGAIGLQRQGVPFARRNGRHVAERGGGDIPDAKGIFIGGLNAENLHRPIGFQCQAEKAAAGHRHDVAGQIGRHVALPIGIRSPGHHAAILHRQGMEFPARHLRDPAGQRGRHVCAHNAGAPGNNGTVGLDRQAKPSAARYICHPALRRNRHIRLVETVVTPGPDPSAPQGQVMVIAGRDDCHVRHRIGGHRIEFLILAP